MRITSPLSSSAALCALLLALSRLTFAATLPPEPQAAPSNTTAAYAHSPAEESHLIRKHKLKKLVEHLTIDAETLHSMCRYESDIALAPPPKKVALTFDDGPEPGQTEMILALLEKHKVPATFFLIGEKAQNHPELVAQVRASPRALIGNHSWSHPNFHDIPAAEQSSEVEKTAELLAKTVPQKLFRYPYGNSSCETNQLLRTMDYKIVGWHVDSCDWAYDHNGTVDTKDAAICGVLPQNRDNFLNHVISSVRAHDGGIILMHEIHPNTLKQLDTLITRLLADGYSFGRMDDADFEKYLR